MLRLIAVTVIIRFVFVEAHGIGEQEEHQGFEFRPSRKVGFATFDSLLYNRDKFSYKEKSTRDGLHPLVTLTILKTYLERYSSYPVDAPSRFLRPMFDKNDQYFVSLPFVTQHVRFSE